ncbi:GNAT family N-acetyltransferase [Streptomyces sp. NPDC059456]|uniref:GNAT family N-acetyltransferase n=1 Tax=Streptomyces sp. NPDC059456 TaxID=3346838 RepID=UPI0036B3D665
MNTDLSFAQDEDAVRRAWPVFAQLRPHIGDAEELVRRWRRQQSEGYRLVLARPEGSPTVLGAAGFRLLTTMAWGRVLYLDDLIVDEASRGTGLGGQLLDFVKAVAGSEECDQVHLDTGYHRHAAHNTYLRAGFRFNCHHLALPLKEA